MVTPSRGLRAPLPRDLATKPLEAEAAPPLLERGPEPEQGQQVCWKGCGHRGTRGPPDLHAGRSPAWGGTEALAAGLHSHGTEATLDHLVTPTCSRTAIRRTVWNDKVLFTPQSAGWTFHIDSKLNISPFSAQMFLTHRWGRGLGGAPWCAWPGGRAPPSCS